MSISMDSESTGIQIDSENCVFLILVCEVIKSGYNEIKKFECLGDTEKFFG